MDPDRALTVRARVIRGTPPGFTLDVDLTVPPGITVVTGPSGAGKSTLLAVIAGLLTPVEGRITLAGTVLHDGRTRVDVPPHRRHVALVFQSLALFPHLTVQANVAYGIPRARFRAVRASQALEALERFHVGHVARRYPGTLSVGEAQRVALARAVAMQPRALLLDEPFSALDATLRTALTADLCTLARALTIPVVHVTHDRAEALALADRVVVIQHGRVAAQGAPTETLAHGL